MGAVFAVPGGAVGLREPQRLHDLLAQPRQSLSVPVLQRPAAVLADHPGELAPDQKLSRDEALAVYTAIAQDVAAAPADRAGASVLWRDIRRAIRNALPRADRRVEFILAALDDGRLSGAVGSDHPPAAVHEHPAALPV